MHIAFLRGSFGTEKLQKMTELLTSAQMRAIERAVLESGAVTGLALMERAGAGVVAAILAEWPALAQGSHRAVVLCGPGNNGGDGFVVARLLHQRGWDVHVLLYGAPDRLPPDAHANFRRWQAMGRVDFHDPEGLDSVWVERAIFALDPTQPLSAQNFGEVVVVDALFGLGLTRPLGDAGGLLSEVREDDLYDLRCRLVAIDIPSGLCADSGRLIRDDGPTCHARAADLTVTFHRRKLGHVLQDGPRFCGRLRVVDIGLPDTGEGLREVQPRPQDLDKSSQRGWWGRTGGDHKFTHGHALILSGPMGRGGAARLAARGALRIGAGLVTLGAPPDAMAEHAAQLTAIMLREMAGPEALTDALADRRITALCLGPGMGVDRAAALLPVARQAPAVVLDADALTTLAGQSNWPALLSPRCILTPHAGEFARLFPDLAAKLAASATRGPAYSKLDATREAAARAGCVVLFKGADTVIAAPDGRAAINAAVYDRAAPWLATAGSGDVLAGFITGLLARGFQPLEAACTGAWLHVEAAMAFGPGLIAEDLPETLPQVFRALGL